MSNMVHAAEVDVLGGPEAVAWNDLILRLEHLVERNVNESLL